MFYCEKCRIKNDWPQGLMKSIGCCEICKKGDVCHDVPSKYLPKSKQNLEKKET